MINSSKMNLVLADYRHDFMKPDPSREGKTHWECEQYKWIAVKHFQDHWDIEADDFTSMFKEATAKCYNLLDSMNYFPRGMIISFANADPNAVREMFRDLFDERTSVVDRINRFISEAERLRSTYGAEQWGSHYQNVNSVSTYLWLKYPDKYYIYKYSECKQAAASLESDFKVKKGAKADVIISFVKFYDEIAEYLASDDETINMVRSALSSECYEDPQYRTLAIDIGFYISRFFSKKKAEPQPENPTPKVVYWPSAEDYSLNITKEEWKKYITEVEMPDHGGCMSMLKALMELGGEASCKKLATVYGGNSTRYVGSAVNIGKRAKKYFNLPPCMDGDSERYFAIPFLGRTVIEDGGEYYSYKIREELHAALSELDLSSIDPYVHLEEASSGYWWLNANPKIWSFADLPVGEEQSYTLFNDNGNKRRIFQNFLDVKVGDTIIGYESTPVKQVVAIARVTQEQDGTEIRFEKTEGLSVPIDYQTLKGCPELESMEYFGQPQGSLFKLTKDEYDCIMDLIRESNPAAEKKAQIESYTKADFLSQVYMTEERYDALVAILKNKKNIILQGAPGVGKTFAAKRLAYSVMGVKDDSRIEFIQFHQNYSYEDFIMGYKPQEDGFKLTNGIFYQFCMNAANQPEKDFFFIIDEINRGNMSKIFGELLMLIERDYRGTKATLAYSGMPFSVPKNLYIIGMMNTADRSLSMIDYALRRRFSFFEMEPGFKSEGFLAYQGSLNNEVFNALIDQIIDLNKEISSDASLGSGFRIGHSYFCGQDEASTEWMKAVVYYDILPMLQEYWFDDRQKVKRWENNLSGVFNDY